MTSIEVDKYFYIKHVDGHCLIICLYVDDMLIYNYSLDIIHKPKIILFFNFDIKDMGETSVISGMKIIRNNDDFILTQGHHVEKIL